MKKLYTLMAFIILISSGYAQEEAEQLLKAIVKVKSTIPNEARTAEVLGTTREGNGVLIDTDGHILTIGYLILEADSIEVEDQEGQKLPAKYIGYDHKTGFGLIRAEKALNITPIQFGRSSDIKEGDPVLVIGHGGEDSVLGARVVLRGEFIGYWEYLLENAIYTTPPYAGYGGAALIGRDGKLLGIGSIYTRKTVADLGTVPCNMFVPIDLLQPILNQLIATGRSGEPPQPWLGLQIEEVHERLFVRRVTEGGPAGKAGLGSGDIILKVDKKSVQGLADYYRKVWSLGKAGVEVPMAVLQGTEILDISVRSEDRDQYYMVRPNK
ncbi:MAG: S1C family serine protease [Desulfobacterales bacterium]|jgi:S1-C subfamily serine protease